VSRLVGPVAAVWGFAEATLFFIVPDVWLTFVVERRWRPALGGCLVATAGALLGGAVMYAWGGVDAAGAGATIERVPAIDAAMIERVDARMQDGWPAALLGGAFVGTPYKIFAVRAADREIPLLAFLLVSVPARLARFVAATLIAGALFRTVFRSWPRRRRVIGLAIFWLVFYAAFLILMPW
jgi:membrane protein YqaA with SNARE-associated domain